MSDIDTYISQKLTERKAANNYRSLKVVEGKIDFTSNDYLGLARDAELKHLIEVELKTQEHLIGSTGSRLLSGNSAYVEDIENTLAASHHAPSALIINSGFDANYGLLSTLPYKGDTILYDELVHASIHDGIAASKANSCAFRHNDVAELRERLTIAGGKKYIVIESLYSMDGDIAPIEEIAILAAEFGAGLIVDEAHATGVLGSRGMGLVGELNLENKCLARIHTFSKALGGHGAVILCSQNLKEFLINYCRPFIFSTALPFHTLAAIKCAYQYFPVLAERREKLKYLIQIFQEELSSGNYKLLTSHSPIQSLIIPDNIKVKEVAQKLQEQGFDIRPILYPTVAKGTERIRICLHSFNTEMEVKSLIENIKKITA